MPLPLCLRRAVWQLWRFRRRSANQTWVSVSQTNSNGTKSSLRQTGSQSKYLTAAGTRSPSPLPGVTFGVFIIGHLYNEALLNIFNPTTENVANRWQCLFTFRHGDCCQRNWNFLGTTCFKTKASKPFSFFLSFQHYKSKFQRMCFRCVLFDFFPRPQYFKADFFL